MTLAVMDELEPRLTKGLVTQTPSGTLRVRLDDFVKRRAVLLDTLVAYRRSAAALSPNPTIATRRRRIRHRLKNEVAVVFAPEFACHMPPEQPLLLDAVSILCESESWDSMRRYYGLTSKGARAVITAGCREAPRMRTETMPTLFERRSIGSLPWQALLERVKIFSVRP